MICQNCGKDLLDDAKFCSNCGKPVSEEESVWTMFDSQDEDDWGASDDESHKRALEKEYQSKLKSELHQVFNIYGDAIEDDEPTDEDTDGDEDTDNNEDKDANENPDTNDDSDTNEDTDAEEDDTDDSCEPYRILNYHVESGILAIMDQDGNEIFSAECDMPGREEISDYEIGVVKTYYYIPDFIIYKNGTWKIFDLKKGEHYAVRAVWVDKTSRMISEFDSIEIMPGAILYSSEGKFGLLSKRELNETSGEDEDRNASEEGVDAVGEEAHEKEYELIPVANCVYDSIEKVINGVFAYYSGYFKAVLDGGVYIISAQFGVIAHIENENEEDDETDAVIYIAAGSQNSLHVASNGDYNIYEWSDISDCYGDTISDYCLMDPTVEYRIEKCVDEKRGLFIVSKTNFAGTIHSRKTVYGVMRNTQVLFDIENDWIEAVQHTSDTYLFIVRSNGNYGVYSEHKEAVIPQRFTCITPEAESGSMDTSKDIKKLTAEDESDMEWGGMYQDERKSNTFVACNFDKKLLVTVKNKGRYMPDGYPWEVEYKEIKDSVNEAALPAERERPPVARTEDDEGAEYFFRYCDFEDESKPGKYRFVREELKIYKDEEVLSSDTEDDELVFGSVKWLDRDLTEATGESDQDIIFGGHIAIFKEEEQWEIYDMSAEEYLYPEKNFLEILQYGKVLIYSEKKESGEKLFGIAYYCSETESIQLVTESKYMYLEAKALNRPAYIVVRGKLELYENHFIGKKGIYATDRGCLNEISGYIGDIFHMELFGTALHIGFTKNRTNYFYTVLDKGDKVFETRYSFKLIQYCKEESENYRYIFWCMDEDKNLKRIRYGKAEEYGKYVERTGEVGKLPGREGKIIIQRDGFVGMVNLYGEILIPFRFAGISGAKLRPDTEFILDDFGKRGFAVVGEKADYIIPCDYESIEQVKGSDVVSDIGEEDIIIPINWMADYLRVKKMGRYAYYNMKGELAIHFRKL